MSLICRRFFFFFIMRFSLILQFSVPYSLLHNQIVCCWSRQSQDKLSKFWSIFLHVVHSNFFYSFRWRNVFLAIFFAQIENRLHTWTMLCHTQTHVRTTQIVIRWLLWVYLCLLRLCFFFFFILYCFLFTQIETHLSGAHTTHWHKALDKTATIDLPDVACYR